MTLSRCVFLSSKVVSFFIIFFLTLDIVSICFVFLVHFKNYTFGRYPSGQVCGVLFDVGVLGALRFIFATQVNTTPITNSSFEECYGMIAKKNNSYN